jgi:leucyl aminopeptidase
LSALATPAIIDVQTSTTLPENLTHLLVLSFESGETIPFETELNSALTTPLKEILKTLDYTFKSKSCEVFYPVFLNKTGPSKVVFAGLGKSDALTLESLRVSVAEGFKALKPETGLTIVLPESVDTIDNLNAIVEAINLVSNQFKPFKVAKPEDKVFANLTLVTKQTNPDLGLGALIGQTVNFVRNITDLPGSHFTPSDMVSVAQKMGALGITVKAIQGKELVATGLHMLHGVGKGSQHAPALIAMDYNQGGDKPYIALVGKGITFDTGGICIKPRAGMEDMKTDMHGAASVLGAMRLIAHLKLPLNVVGVIATAENMPNGNALKPGDVVTAYNGMTIEVKDTDAEGRLVLADALSYAVRHFDPKTIINLATLTGSIVVSLGSEATGLFSLDNNAAKQFAIAGEAVGERTWHMPNISEYKRMIKSDIADVSNSADERGDAIAAAFFLHEFADAANRSHIHLDIAGSSEAKSAKGYHPAGSTGVGPRLILEYLKRYVL